MLAEYFPLKADPEASVKFINYSNISDLQSELFMLFFLIDRI